MSSQIEEIKSRIDIVELVGSYLKLQKAGANFKALCPFHGERTPSFNVSPARQIWHCFGCGKGGDALAFVQEIDGVEFPEALKMLADRAGVKLQSEDPKLRSERTRLLNLMEEATKFFEDNLVSTPLNYLFQRGLTDETIKEFRLGYAPTEWKSLFTCLTSNGFSAADIEKAGLAIRNSSTNYKQQTTNYYDRFRGRIIFPVFDYNGKVVAFGGRVFPDRDNDAKYVNSPETPLYQKSKTLYGLHKTKSEILKSGTCVLVEGYMDMLMSYQAGVKNVVASSGTALTQDQLRTLRRLSEKLVTSFDMDAAGEEAAKRGIRLALEAGFDVRVVSLEGAKDPAEAAAQDSDILTEAVRAAKHIARFYIDSALNKYGAATPEAKREFQKRVLPVVSALPELECAHWVREISGLLDIKEEAVWSAIAKIQNPNFPPADWRAGKFQNKEEGLAKEKTKTRKALLEERILSIVASFPALAEKLEPNVANLLPKENRTAFFAELLLNGLQEAEVELAHCQREFKRELLKEQMSLLASEIYKAEKEHSEAPSSLISEFQQISNKLREL